MVCVLASSSPGHGPAFIASLASVPILVAYNRIITQPWNMPPWQEVLEADALAEKQPSKYIGEYQQVSCRLPSASDSTITSS